MGCGQVQLPSALWGKDPLELAERLSDAAHACNPNGMGKAKQSNANGATIGSWDSASCRLASYFLLRVWAFASLSCTADLTTFASFVLWVGWFGPRPSTALVDAGRVSHSFSRYTRQK